VQCDKHTAKWTAHPVASRPIGKGTVIRDWRIPDTVIATWRKKGLVGNTPPPKREMW